MRHGRAAKQRLWLGAIGHFCGCQRRLTKPDSNSNRDCNCHRNTNSDGDCNCDSNTYANANSYTNRNSKHYAQAGSYITPASYAAAEAIRRDFRAIS